MSVEFPIAFTKMSGTGNDFIIIDHRGRQLAGLDLAGFVQRVCRRKFSVGADGLILIEDSETADFKWRFFNGDGSMAEMCGNGARCAARFAFENGIAPPAMRFETVAGVIEAQVTDGAVKIRLTNPEEIRLALALDLAGEPAREIHFINTGVPHVVMFADEVTAVPVEEWGRTIRFHGMFQPAGTNVNFVEIVDRRMVKVRTYERGVEGETMACGTGAVASAVAAALLGLVEPPVIVLTSGGEKLVIHFSLFAGPECRQLDLAAGVFLEGPAHVIYQGALAPDCLL